MQLTLKWFRKKYIQRTYMHVYTYTEVVYIHECIGIYRDVYVYVCIYTHTHIHLYEQIWQNINNQ